MGLMEVPTKILETLTLLRLKGIGLSIDDFGTGFSSMQQLKTIPFTELKVDRAFVNGASIDPETRAMLKSSGDLTRAGPFVGGRRSRSRRRLERPDWARRGPGAGLAHYPGHAGRCIVDVVAREKDNY